jgi:hypothetical protein
MTVVFYFSYHIPSINKIILIKLNKIEDTVTFSIWTVSLVQPFPSFLFLIVILNIVSP